MQRARKDRGVYAGGKVDGKNSNGWRERWKEDEKREKRMMENRRREKEKKKGRRGEKREAGGRPAGSGGEAGQEQTFTRVFSVLSTMYVSDKYLPLFNVCLFFLFFSSY